MPIDSEVSIYFELHFFCSYYAFLFMMKVHIFAKPECNYRKFHF